MIQIVPSVHEDKIAAALYGLLAGEWLAVSSAFRENVRGSVAPRSYCSSASISLAHSIVRGNGNWNYIGVVSGYIKMYNSYGSKYSENITIMDGGFKEMFKGLGTVKGFEHRYAKMFNGVTPIETTSGGFLNNVHIGSNENIASAISRASVPIAVISDYPQRLTASIREASLTCPGTIGPAILSICVEAMRLALCGHDADTIIGYLENAKYSRVEYELNVIISSIRKAFSGKEEDFNDLKNNNYTPFVISIVSAVQGKVPTVLEKLRWWFSIPGIPEISRQLAVLS
jgi:hypothetical protein